MPKSRIPSQIKSIIIERAREGCEYCQTPLDFFIDPFVTEHIIPKSQGGKSDLLNLALSCQGCNSFKYNKTTAVDPATEIVVPLYHPRRDKFRVHFAWNEDFTLLVGLTPTGRATIDQLQLNRTGVVNLRRVLFVMGDYPVDDEGNASSTKQ